MKQMHAHHSGVHCVCCTLSQARLQQPTEPEGDFAPSPPTPAGLDGVGGFSLSYSSAESAFQPDMPGIATGWPPKVDIEFRISQENVILRRLQACEVLTSVSGYKCGDPCDLHSLCQ